MAVYGWIRQSGDRATASQAVRVAARRSVPTRRHAPHLLIDTFHRAEFNIARRPPAMIRMIASANTNAEGSTDS
jgi:hypothetical protein